MKIIITLALCVAVAQAGRIGLQSRDIEIPEDKLFPSHTAAEWRAIYEAQIPQQEVVENYKPGTEPQSEDAGALRGDAETRIIRGTDAVSGEFPWQVSIRMDGSYFCGGSIISNRYILSAGHCVIDVSTFVVGLGSINPNGGTSGAVSQTSRDSILHSGYNDRTLVNDIGLIHLTTAVAWSNTIGPVRLPKASIGDLNGRSVLISGWGKTTDNALGIASTLKKATLTVITNTLCAGTFGSSITSGNICTAGKVGTSATCNGDSGGPLVVLESDGHYTEVGIVSFGTAKCETGNPDVFTRVSSFLNWIETNSGVTIRRE